MKKIFLFLSVILLSSLKAMAAEPYALLSDNNTKLTFYYGTKPTSGMSVGPFTNDSGRGWNSVASTITTVEFHESMANCNTITSTRCWFYNLEKLTTITGIENLKTANVTDMSFVFYCCRSLTSLDLRGFDTGNVTSMRFMFCGCSGLTSLDVSKFDTGKVTDMRSMFEDCSSLTSLDVSEFDTGNVTDMGAMFSYCFSLTSLDVSGFKTGNVTNMLGMFSDCSSLTSLDLSGFNTSNVENMAYMFRDCSSLTSLDVSGFDTGKVTKMENMFSLCSSLTSLNLNGFNTGNVTTMADMFWDCSSLTSLNLSGFNTSNVEKMSYMFRDCSSLTSLDVSGFDTGSVKSMSGMFSGCSALTILDVSGFDTGSVTDMSGMFADCSSLTSLDLSGFNTGSVKYMGNMFIGCSSLKAIYCYDIWNQDTPSQDMFLGCTSLVGGDGTHYSADHVTAAYAHPYAGGYFSKKPLPYALLSDNNTKLTFYYGSMPANGMSVGPFESYIERGWNSCKTSITRVVFDESMTNCHSITSTANWFNGLSNLVDITHLEYLNTEKVKSLVDMFYGCHCLKSIDVSHFDISKVTDMSWMFAYCLDLKTIYCDISWTSVPISTEMFLSSGSIVGGDGTTYTTGHYDATYAHPFDGGYFTKKPKTYALLSENNTKLTFYYGTKPANGMDVGPFESAAERGWNNYKSSITTVEFDESMVDSDITSTAYWFANLDNLTSFNDRYLNTSSVTDMKYMFSNCHSLTSLHLASGFDTGNVKDMGYMFNNCYNLEAVYNSYNFETWYVKNMGYMFYNCKKLKTIHLRNFRAKNATNLEYMFSYCSSLTTLDLSSFDTGMVTTMRNMFYNCTSLTALDLSNFTTPQTADLSEMFYGCSNLQTIYCYNAWNSQIYSSNMFYNCKSLIGGDGTVWSASFVTATFAHPNIGGYFSKKPYALLSEDRTTLTFYYGIMPTDGMNIGPFNRSVSDEWEREWGSASYKITTLIFDESMDNCHNITSTAGWFQNMDKLTTITHLDYLHTENVTDMQNMFAWCQGLKSLDMSHFITAKVTNMKAMFIDCRSLESLNLSTFNTANVTNMEQMFYNCKSLISLNISSFNTQNVTNMNGMFSDCKALTSLDVSHFDTSKVTTMEYMFYQCAELTSLDLTNFNTSKVTNTDWMFYGCDNLRTIYCYDTWNPEIGPNMFRGCKNLVGGTGTHYSADHVTAAYAHPNEGGYFTKKPLPYALLSDNNTKLTFYYGAKPDEGMDFGPFADTTKRGWNSAATTITTVEFDASMGSCSNITSTAFWFSGFSNLTTITGLDNLKTTNVEDMKYMFAECSQLNSLDLRTFDTRNVKSFEGFLYYCFDLQSIDLSSFDTRNVLSMEKMFRDCHCLTSLDLRGFNTNKVGYMAEMFYSCFQLTTIFCNDYWNPSTGSKDMFSNCVKLKGGSGFSYSVGCTNARYANPYNGYFTEKQIILGDVNDDGNVTPADAIMILYHYFGVNQNGFHRLAADVNGDGNITPADAIEALYIYFGAGSHNGARAAQPMTGSSRDPE